MPPPLDLLPPLLHHIWLTIVLLVGGAALAAVCALLAGLGRRSRDPIVRAFSAVYVETFRGSSALVQLFWFFYALPVLLDISFSPVTAGILVLGLNIGAYGAEVVRSAVASVPPGQVAAATALNMTRTQTMRHVVLPQALLIMLPPIGNLLVELLKSTALVSLITVVELTRTGFFLYEEMPARAVEIFSLLLVIYFLLSRPITWGVRWLERRLKRGLIGGEPA